MRIAFLSYDFPEYCIRHANELAESSEVLLMLPQATTQDYLSLISRQVRFIPFHKPRLRQPTRQLLTALKLVRTIRRFEPNVVHFQNGHMYFNLLMPLLKKFPLVVTIHDPRQHLGDSEAGRTPQRIMDFGFRCADQVIVHGRRLTETVVCELDIDRKRVHVIPHVAIGENAEGSAIRDDQLSILFFGRIWEYKGLEFLIRAQPRVSAEFPDAKFVIAGRGEDFERYRKMMVDPERFDVHNDWISDAQRSEMFASCSLVVLPYIEASQSGVIPIAYTYEKPVVVSDIGGLPDMVDVGITGLLIPPRDADALAEAILQLLRDRETRMHMGRAGKDKLARECSPQVVVRQTMDVYHRAISAREGRPARSAFHKELETK